MRISQIAKRPWLLLLAVVGLVLSPGDVVPGADAARILVVIAMPAPSHHIVFTALTRTLADRGHHITLVTPLDKDSKLLPRHNHTIVSARNAEQDAFIKKSLAMFTSGEAGSVFLAMWQFFTSGPWLVRGILDHPDFKAEIHKPGQKFDLVITEAYFMQEAMVALGHQFKAPVVALNPFGTTSQVDDIMGNPSNPAYTPNVIVGLPDRMTFKQRVISLLSSVGFRLVYWWYQLPVQERLVEEHFPDAPPLKELLRDQLALTLLNSHYSLNYPVPMAPGVVEVGGMHIPDKPKPLPKDLRDLMDGAKEGVVYFSMGSNLRMEFLPKEKMHAIFNALGSLKQRVLLKWDGPVPEQGVAPNIKVLDWAPQADILAHPNLRLFVTHGGLLSTQESVYHAVPLVGMPFFGDQESNMRLAQHKGFAVQVSFMDLTEEKLTAALKEVLGSPKFKESASRLSQLFRSKPQRPNELAAFWVEHVLQHGGAHLRPASVDLALYQVLLLDVLAVLLVPVVLLVLAVRALCRCCCGRKEPKGNEKKKKE